MDLITKSLMDTFRQQQSLSDDIDKSTLFEHFSNFCIISKEYTEEFGIDDVHVAGGNDLQLDGAAIIVNGILVGSIEEVDDLAKTNKYIHAEFIFVQAKSGSNFSGADISNMFYGIRELFSNEPKQPRNEALTQTEEIIRHIYKNSAYFRHGNPLLKMYYVATGKWSNEKKLVYRIKDEISTLEDLNIFKSPPTFEAIDARRLQDYFNRSQNALVKTVDFAKRVTIPHMEGVKEAYLGFLTVKQYVDMITDEKGILLRGLFIDNVRDFQGDNPVNQEIEETIKSAFRDSFILLNNGVTIVAEDLKPTGDAFTLTGFQIVNGCQTSHVLFNNQDVISDEMLIPVKLIVGPNDDLKNQVIKATNRQTVVKTEELSALTDFQKVLESYYNAIDEEHRLYYERRSRQYRGTPGLEKGRIVTISAQIRSFSSMFLNKAHQASRYYGTLLKDIELKIFRHDHFPIAYYVCSYALYKFEICFRRKIIDNQYRPFKYHLLGIFRLVTAGSPMPQMMSNRFENYCEKIRSIIWDTEKLEQAITKSIDILNTVTMGNLYRDKAKDSTIINTAKEYLLGTYDTFHLHFDGYWIDDNKGGIPEEGGIYCVYECYFNRKTNTVTPVRIVYIGKALNAREDIASHKEYNKWKQFLRSPYDLCYTFGRFDIPNIDRCKAILIKCNKPIGNKGHEGEFAYDPTYISISGQTALLKLALITNRKKE